MTLGQALEFVFADSIWYIMKLVVRIRQCAQTRVKAPKGLLKRKLNHGMK